MISTLNYHILVIMRCVIMGLYCTDDLNSELPYSCYNEVCYNGTVLY